LPKKRGGQKGRSVKVSAGVATRAESDCKGLAVKGRSKARVKTRNRKGKGKIEETMLSLMGGQG